MRADHPSAFHSRFRPESKTAQTERSIRFLASRSWRPVSFATVLSVSLLVLTLEARAVPITYTLTVYRTPGVATGTSPAGNLGPISFGGSYGDVILTFTFEGDTANVIPFTTPTTPPASGFEILTGVASVQVKGATSGAILAEGTFAPSAGIFVSVDNTNHGMGFGSFGTPPGSSMFPGQVIYPFGMEAYPLGSYDLRSDFSVTLYTAISCVNFPFIAPSYLCGSPIALPTLNSGDLFVNTQYVLVEQNGPTTATFSAKTHSVTTFAAFTATTEINETRPERIDITGKFTLGAGSNGINPSTEPVTVQLGNSTFTVPSGSFKQNHEKTYVFEGLVGGVTMDVSIRPTREQDTYKFHVAGSGANLTGVAPPIPLVLTIGDDSGATIVNIKRED